jgi:hypothetical protein
MPSPRRAAALLAAATLAAASAHADSELTFAVPDVTGAIDASTYDESGARVGAAELAVVRLDDGTYRMSVRSGIEGSAQLDVRADLAPVGDGSRLRLLSQRTESRDVDGRSLGVTRIDHTGGVAVCGAVDESGSEPVTIALPPRDRVVNVPMNLLFQPLVTGESEEVAFQVLVCRAGGRIVDARARVAGGVAREDGTHVVEIRYDLDFGPLLSRIAAPFMPRLSFWFHEGSPGRWVGHRVPLFSKGPTVLVVRSGFTPSGLGAVP